MKLSVIICVYNTAEEYLDACLNSIVNSTLKSLEGEYEICMVDDGSNVDYSNLVKKYGVEYLKTENQGIFAARKTGAFMAKGDFAVFCDSDDTVSFNYHKPMLDTAISLEADIVINDWAYHTERARYCCGKDDIISKDLDFSGEDILKAFTSRKGSQHSYFVLWNKVYKTALLRASFENLIAAGIPERSSYSEDAAINFFAWRDAKRLVNIHTGYYFYRQHTGQTVNVISEERLKAHIEFMSATLSIMENNVGKNRYKDEIIANIQEWRALMSRVHYSHAYENKYTSLLGLLKEKYGVDKLKKATARDSRAYMGNILLGSNFESIDKALFDIWSSDIQVGVKYSKKDKYATRSVEYLRALGKIADIKEPCVEIPKQKNKLIEKLLHNPTIYKISIVLFKKGSKSRAFLKKLF